MPILGEKLLILPLDLYNRSVAALISSIIMLGNCKVMRNQLRVQMSELCQRVYRSNPQRLNAQQ